VESAPDDHLSSGPDSCWKVAGARSGVSAGRRPGICSWLRSWLIASARLVPSSADDHRVARPDRGVPDTWRGRIQGRRRCPGFRRWIVPPPVFREQISPQVHPTPDDHLLTSPDGRVHGPLTRCAGDTGGNPTIRLGIVSTTSLVGDI